MIKLKLSSQLIGQFGHVTASASCKQPEKHGNEIHKQRDPVFSPNPMRPHPLLSCDCYHDFLTATFDPTMRFKRSNSNLENFHDVFGVAAFSLLLTPWRDIS